MTGTGIPYLIAFDAMVAADESPFRNRGKGYRNELD